MMIAKQVLERLRDEFQSFAIAHAAHDPDWFDISWPLASPANRRGNQASIWLIAQALFGEAGGPNFHAQCTYGESLNEKTEFQGFYGNSDFSATMNVVRKLSESAVACVGKRSRRLPLGTTAPVIWSRMVAEIGCKTKSPAIQIRTGRLKLVGPVLDTFTTHIGEEFLGVFHPLSFRNRFWKTSSDNDFFDRMAPFLRDVSDSDNTLRVISGGFLRASAYAIDQILEESARGKGTVIWSEAMRLKTIGEKLGCEGKRRTIEARLQSLGSSLESINRQNYRVRLDTMDATYRQKFEKP